MPPLLTPKMRHFTIRNRNWWTYPFLPYVDLWLEAFHRLDGRKSGSPRLGAGGKKANKGTGGTGRGRGRRPRWNGVVGQAVHGLAPLIVVAVLWRVSLESQPSPFFLNVRLNVCCDL